jgi:hypothetical protein
MQIPNSIIILRLADGTGYGPLILPKYVAPVLKKVFSQRLDPSSPGGGIEVTTYPEDGFEGTRYREVFDVASEIAWLRSVYKADHKGYFVDQVFDVDSLKKEIESMLVAEAARLRAESKPKKLIQPHESFLKFGLTEDIARALQTAGYGDRAACIGQSLMDLNSVHGVTLDIAQRLATDDKK